MNTDAESRGGSISRRRFLQGSAWAASSLAMGAAHRTGAAEAQPVITGGAKAPATKATDGPPSVPAGMARFPIIAFSKPFQKLTPEQTADLVAEVGWDGIECPVRAKGQIEPARAADELPRMVEALGKRGLKVHLLTTDIVSLSQPATEPLLRLMAKLGLKRFRLGSSRYPEDRSPVEVVRALEPHLRDLAAACKDLGLQGALQNHSGPEHVGAAVWDVFPIIEKLDPRHLGLCFDIGHATVEGGLMWPTLARLAEPYYAMIYVKDFRWQREDKLGWKAAWCPLGEGMVNRRYFDSLKRSRYVGPISQHHEYELGDPRERLAYFQRDLKVLKSWL